ncbi:MAG: branched-chain amino acid ABC transporter substrate-binding protein [Actinomycetota bacterium]|nr:branched-chain amino acid ABC transporter substrate-binding protein [Actinomycetota bacterium]
MKRTRVVRIAGVVAGLSLLTAACGGDDDDTSTDDTEVDGGGGDATEYHIAYVGPLTGDAANLGIFIRDGAKTAVEEFNESQDEIEIVLDEHDTQGDPAQAPTVAADYVNDEDVLGIVGPAFSGETKAVVPTLEDAGLVMVSASATNVQLPDTVPDGKVFHRVLADDAAQAKGLVKYLTTTLKPATIAIVHDNSEYGQGLAVNELAAQLEGTDVEVVATEAIDPDSEDYSAAVNTVKGANPEAVFFAGYYEEAGTLAKQLRDEGVTATFISADGSLDPGFIDGAGEAAEGAQISCPCNLATEASPGALGEFATSYQEINGSEPGTYSTEAYDAANILIAGIVAGNTDRASLLEYVEGLTSVPDAISKDVSFAPNGNIEAQGIFLFEVKGGEFVPLIATDDIPQP